MNKRIIIIGATSGIGREVANIYIAQGWKVGVAGRRAHELETLRQTSPSQVFTQVLDVTNEDAPQRLQALIEQVGGMDIFLLSSGIGKQNYILQTEIELATAATNVEGFIGMTNAAYHYFEQQGHGHLAVISSIA
jgi:NADP-dependent 3-hydroxy acid dehydrogenase YdfG